ncbi:MAG: DUF11 domain-containing protein [Candidatus Methanoperedens sp.]|nr:DUF11 domain-containing protein [Candidatus Methanoperedens sp.]
MKYTALIWIVISIILPLYIGPAHAFDTSQLQFRDGVSGKLIRGEELSYAGYSIKIIGFPSPVTSEKYEDVPDEPVEPFVMLNISKNGSFINSTALGSGESYIVPDGELKITADQLPSPNAREWIFQNYHPWAVIKLNPRGTPKLDVLVETDYDSYISSPATEITATVTIANNGFADAKNVDLYFDTELPLKRESLKYHYESLKIGESITETITLSPPYIDEKKSYDIRANLSGYDAKDIPYKVESLTTIIIVPESQQMPGLKKSTNARIYLKDYAMVSLSLKNNANYDLKNVSIKDSLPKGFKLMGNKSLNWVVNIPAKGEWDSRYLIKPLEANNDGVTLPAATAEFRIKGEYYIIQSGRPEILIYGPKVELTKLADVTEVNPGDTVTVTVTAINTGGTPTKVTIWDQNPQDNGNRTMHEEFLEAGRDFKFSYTVKIDSEQPIILPRATAEYYELGATGGKITTESKELEIAIIPPPVITPEEETPVVESIDNSSYPAISEETGIYDPVQEVPEEPEIAETPSNEQPAEINGFLNLLLGCDNGTDDKTPSAACDYFNQQNNTY